MNVKFEFDKVIEKYGIIFINIFINNKQAIMLVDTGSIGNIIDANFIKSLNINIPKFKSGKVSGFNFDDNFDYSYKTLENVYIENVFKTNIDFIITDLTNTIKSFRDEYNINVSGILGTDFLNKNKLIINYKNKIIEYENNN